MDNEEKKVKTTKSTTPKKKTTAVKATAKKTTTKKTVTKKVTEKKVEPEKKATAVKKETTKKTSTAKKETQKKVAKPKEIKKEEVTLPVVEEKIEVEKEKKVVTEPIEEEKVSKKELKEIRKKRYLIEAIVVTIIAIIVLILLTNRTFLSLNYKNKNLSISIPRFSYFISDEDHEVKLITLRKSEYLKEYFNEYLEGFTFYSCAEGKKTFYYNEQTKTLIKEIEIEKKFALKTIEISYDTKTPEEVCGLR